MLGIQLPGRGLAQLKALYAALQSKQTKKSQQFFFSYNVFIFKIDHLFISWFFNQEINSCVFGIMFTPYEVNYRFMKY